MSRKGIMFSTLKLVIGLTILISVVCPVSEGRGGEAQGNIAFRDFNPHLRAKKGPPLTGIFNKTNGSWLFQWIKEPGKHDPTSRMPNLSLSDEEVLAALSFLRSIAPGDVPSVEWPDYLFKPEDDLSDDEYDLLLDLLDRGKALYRQARCSICHRAGKRGGVVALRVGINLEGVSGKVKRDWLYRWLKDPSSLFPDTFMPRFRFSDEDIRALVEYLMRDADFAAEETPRREITLKEDEDALARGKRVIGLSRCVLCHQIDGIEEVLPQPERPIRPQDGFARLLREVKCLSCHSIRGQGGDYAPDLTYAGSKLKAGWIADFLEEPDLIRPLSQQMPRLFLSREEAEEAEKFIKEELVFDDELLAQVPEVLRRGDVSGLQAKAEEGRKVFEKKGCFSCHTVGGKGGALGPDLGMAAERLEPAYVYLHLKDPGRFVPFTREPDLGLSDEEALSLTVFLMNPVD